MVEKQLSEEDIILDDIVTGPYKYGFKTEIETESFPKGLDLNIIQKIIEKKTNRNFYKNFVFVHLTIGKRWKVQRGLILQLITSTIKIFNTIQFQKQKRSWGA